MTSLKSTAPIRRCQDSDFDSIFTIVNDAAEAYKGKIPSDCWKDPYMPREELLHEINDGVEFWGYQDEGELVGVMGVQPVKDVTLIRHAYVRTAKRAHGIGSALLSFLRDQTSGPVLVGTWAAAVWAIAFYEKHGFLLVSTKEKDELLKKYWSISPRQIETSVVLANKEWLRLTEQRKAG